MVFDNLMNPFLEVKWQRLEVKGGVVIVRGKQLQWLSPNPPALPPKKVRYFVKDHQTCGLFTLTNYAELRRILGKSCRQREITRTRQDFDATLDLRIFQIEDLIGADRTISRRRHFITYLALYK